MKKIFASLLILAMCFSLFASGAKEAAPKAENKLMLGMVTDAGTIDDRSFNQGTWEGIKRAADEYGVKCDYLRPAGTTTVDYVTAISDLYDQGYRFIACPGYLFSNAVYQAQTMYPDLKLIILDATPTDDAGNTVIGENTVAVSWKEQESGFLAGVATALQIQEGDVGFVGGIQVPAVQKFNWGFQQGITYANKTYGTKIGMDPSNFTYSGSFADLALGQQLAMAMYNKGVEVVFAAAGGTGVGVINEAKNRRLSGQDVWAVGVDVDQYSVGDMGNGKSAILTSAMKYVDVAAYNEAVNAINGTFKGGVSELLGAAEEALGIPQENPNLRPEVQEEVFKVNELIKNGTITIQDNANGLIP